MAKNCDSARCSCRLGRASALQICCSAAAMCGAERGVSRRLIAQAARWRRCRWRRTQVRRRRRCRRPARRASRLVGAEHRIVQIGPEHRLGGGRAARATSAPGPSAPSARTARPPAPDRAAPRPCGRPADSDRSIAHVPSGATFRRPSSVRRITSAATPMRFGAARMRHTSSRLLDVLDEGRRRCRARAPGACSTSGFFVRPVAAHGQHLLGRARRISDTKCRMWADAEVDRHRIPGRADAEAHPHDRWRGSPPCTAAAAPPGARPRRGRRRPPPSRSAADSCASRRGTSCRRSAAPRPRACAPPPRAPAPRADTIGSRMSPSAASAFSAACSAVVTVMALPFSAETERRHDRHLAHGRGRGWRRSPPARSGAPHRTGRY